MATYEQIVANNAWFKKQISQLDALSQKLATLSESIDCLTIADTAWPDKLVPFKTEYGSAKDTVATSQQLGYSKGSESLTKVADNLEETRRSYIRTEAESETEIAARILTLLDR